MKKQILLSLSLLLIFSGAQLQAGSSWSKSMIEKTLSNNEQTKYSLPSTLNRAENIKENKQLISNDVLMNEIFPRILHKASKEGELQTIYSIMLSNKQGNKLVNDLFSPEGRQLIKDYKVQLKKIDSSLSLSFTKKNQFFKLLKEFITSIDCETEKIDPKVASLFASISMKFAIKNNFNLFISFNSPSSAADSLVSPFWKEAPVSSRLQKIAKLPRYDNQFKYSKEKEEVIMSVTWIPLSNQLKFKTVTWNSNKYFFSNC